jgi:hypothetical protein
MEFWADSSDTELSDGVSLVNMGLSHTQKVLDIVHAYDEIYRSKTSRSLFLFVIHRLFKYLNMQCNCNLSKPTTPTTIFFDRSLRWSD